MIRSKIKRVLLAYSLTLSLASASIAQDVPELDNNFDPTTHDVSLVPRLSAPAVEPLVSDLRMEQGELIQCEDGQTQPTIIVRSAGDNPGCLNGCQLEVEPIKSGIQDRFRVKLSIPDSVEIVEVLPRYTGANDRQVRVSINTDEQKEDPVALTNVKNESADTNQPIGNLRPAKFGFQENPFFAKANVQQPAQIENNDFEPRRFHLSAAKTAPAATAQAMPASRQRLRTNIIGPRTLEAGSTAEFEINLLNPTSQDHRDVVVQLQLPAGLEPLLLDRTAWLDASKRTITWEIDELKSGELEVIHYAVVTTTSGPQLQRVTVGFDDLTQGEAEIRTDVMRPFELPNNVASSDSTHPESHH